MYKKATDYNVQKNIKTKKPSWRDVKQRIADFDQKTLLGLVQDLYNATKENKVFLHTRFNLGDDNLQEYKNIIARCVCPDITANQDILISKAKKAIHDYKKAAGKPECITDLSLFYCESCLTFLSYCSVEYDSYYNAFINALEQALKYLHHLNKEQQKPYIERVIKIHQQSKQYGYYLEDDIQYLFKEYNIA